MIKGLYETHLEVKNLEQAIDFYQDKLGLEFALLEEKRRIAFFWIGRTREYMLGLWEKPNDPIQPRHFAFRCDKDFILQKSVPFLKSKGLQPYNFLKDGTEQPMVFAWMPAVAIYFKDPDENILEFIAILEGESHPEWGVISYEEWMEKQKSGV
ncbi:MAG: VOC family protein [Bacteroidota bacterium]